MGWYYIACTKCNKKVDVLEISEVKEEDLYGKKRKASNGKMSTEFFCPGECNKVVSSVTPR